MVPRPRVIVKGVENLGGQTHEGEDIPQTYVSPICLLGVQTLCRTFPSVPGEGQVYT